MMAQCIRSVTVAGVVFPFNFSFRINDTAVDSTISTYPYLTKIIFYYTTHLIVRRPVAIKLGRIMNNLMRSRSNTINSVPSSYPNVA